MSTYYGNSTGPSGVTFYVVVEYNQQEFVTSGSYSGKYHYNVRRYVYVSQNNGAGTWSRTFKTSWTGSTAYTMSDVGTYADSTIDTYLSPNESQSFSYNAGYTSNSGVSRTSTCSGTYTAPSKTFTMTYTANGGTGSNVTETVEFNSNYITRNNMFSRVGYTFIGWNEKSDGTGIGWTSDIGNNWKWTRTSDILLYAQWRQNELSIQYNANSGIIGSESYLKNSEELITSSEEPHVYTQTFKYGDVMSDGLTSHDTFGLYKLGYKFIGWSLSKDSSTNLYDELKKDYSVTDFTKDIENDDVIITLYAQWKIQNVGYIQVDGVPKLSLMYYREDDTWYPAIGYQKINGIYKQSIT